MIYDKTRSYKGRRNVHQLASFCQPAMCDSTVVEIQRPELQSNRLHETQAAADVVTMVTIEGTLNLIVSVHSGRQYTQF